MELYLPPIIKSKDTRWKKGHKPWNVGRKDWTTKDLAKRAKQASNLAEGRAHLWETRERIAYNAIPVTAYTLAGEYVRTFQSSRKAADALGLIERNIRHCVAGKRGHVGQYQFRPAKIEVYQGQKLVKKENITPYRRRTRWDNQKKIVFLLKK